LTNGDLLTREKYDELIDCGLDVIELTIHDMKPPKFTADKIIIKKLDAELCNRGGLVEVKNNYMKGKTKCNMPNFKALVNVDGKYLFCCNDYFGKYVCGDLRKENLIEIWRKTKNLRQGISSGKLIPTIEICRKCVEYEPPKNK
jgi:hypothetical protein